MRLRARLQVTVMVAQACALLVAVRARAEDGDENPPPAGTPQRFRLDVTDLYAGFESEFEHRRVTSTTPDRRDTTHRNHDLRFIESTGLTLSGFAYDPNLLEYRAALAFGLTQGEFREQIDGWSDTDREHGFLTEYDINVDAFRSKPISLNAYARRADIRVPRRFLPSLREKQTETGVSAFIVGPRFTTELGFSLRDVERFGHRLDEDDEEFDNSRFYIDHKWQFSDAHKLRLLYEHEHDESNYQGSRYSFETQRDEARVEHELLFGPGNKHRIDTYFRTNAEKGDLARDEIELVPRLTLQHKDNFKTIHRYSLYQVDQGGIKVTQNKFDTQAVWDATDKLRITLDGYGMHENVEQDIDINEFGGSIDAAYHQPTALGELSANAAFGFDQARTAGDAGRRYVRGEAHALGGSRPVFLQHVGVIPGTIIAYNATRTRLYVLGVDYTAAVVAGRAVVARTWTGRIAPDEVVTFDYAYEVPTHGSVESYRTDFLIEHRFRFGLTPYYALETRFQEVDYSAATPWLRDNQDRHRLGARFERERWGIGAEYEIFDDTVEPYDAFHLTGRAGLLNSAAHTLDLSAELSRYEFEGGFDRRDMWWCDMDLADRSRITEWLWLKANTAYHFENDSVDGDTHGVDVELGLELKRGWLSVDLTVEYDLLSLPRGDEEGVGIFLNVRRDLSHVLPAVRTVR